MLRPSDRQILALLGDHGVLTSGQLVVLSGMPERTVQYRLGRLERSGLLNRLRPAREVGTSPYHCWLTPFGAAAVGADRPRAWRDDTAGVQAVAALSHLFFAVRDHGGCGGVFLAGWRRLPAGLCFCDPRTETVRELPAEAELTVTGGRLDTAATVLVVAQVEGVPAARVEAVLARFAGFLATTSGTSRPLLGVLARTHRVAERVLIVAAGLEGAPAARRLDPATLSLARHRIAAGLVEPHPAWRPSRCGRRRGTNGRGGWSRSSPSVPGAPGDGAGTGPRAWDATGDTWRGKAPPPSASPARQATTRPGRVRCW